MQTLIRTLRLLAIVVWVGGIVFFAFVLAPVAFHLLPSPHLAGMVVGGTLRVLDVMGLISGAVFLAATATLLRQPDAVSKKRYKAHILLVSIMLVATAYVHAGVLPAMDRDRALAGGDIEAASSTSMARIHFELLHKRSEAVEGAVLLCGLAIVALMAGETLPTRR